MAQPLSRRRLLRNGGAAIAGLSLGGWLSACGSDDDDESSAGGGDGSTTTTAAAAGTATTAAGVEVATVRYPVFAGVGGIVNPHTRIIMDRGLAEKHSIELATERVPIAEIASGIVIGRFDTAYLGALQIGAAAQEGRPLVCYGALNYQHAVIVVPADSALESFEELEGKTVATLAPSSSQYTSLQVMTAERGFDFEQDVSVLTGDHPFIVSVLERGDADAGVLNYPGAVKQIQSGKYRILADLNEVWLETRPRPLPGLVWAVPKEFYDESPDVVGRLLAMGNEASQIIKDDTEAIFTEYAEEVALDTPEEIALAAERCAPLYATDWGQEDIDGLRYLFERSAALGISEPLSDEQFDEMFVLGA